MERNNINSLYSTNSYSQNKRKIGGDVSSNDTNEEYIPSNKRYQPKELDLIKTNRMLTKELNSVKHELNSIKHELNQTKMELNKTKMKLKNK